MSATLEPLPVTVKHQAPDIAQDAQVIAILPINTHRLDAIEGLENVVWRSEEHTSELQSLHCSSYAVFRLTPLTHVSSKLSMNLPRHHYHHFTLSTIIPTT